MSRRDKCKTGISALNGLQKNSVNHFLEGQSPLPVQHLFSELTSSCDWLRLCKPRAGIGKRFNAESAEVGEKNLRTIGCLGAADLNAAEKRARLNARLDAIVFEFPGWDGDEAFGN